MQTSPRERRTLKAAAAAAARREKPRRKEEAAATTLWSFVLRDSDDHFFIHDQAFRSSLGFYPVLLHFAFKQEIHGTLAMIFSIFDWNNLLTFLLSRVWNLKWFGLVDQKLGHFVNVKSCWFYCQIEKRSYCSLREVRPSITWQSDRPRGFVEWASSFQFHSFVVILRPDFYSFT